MSKRARGLVAVLLTFVFAGAPALADVQVNSADHNAPNLGNATSESETNVARFGSVLVVGYNSSRQAGLLGAGAFNSFSGFAYSGNGGATFTDAGFVPAGTGTLSGDPALAFDGAGTLYYASIANDGAGFSRIAVNRSTATSPAVTFGNPVYVAGLLPGAAPFEDKELIAVDTTGGMFNGRVYVAWSEFPSIFTPTPRLLVAASSTTSPLTFSATQAVSPATGFHHGAIPVVGPDGAVYVAWNTFTTTSSPSSTTINVVKSTNGGGGYGNPDISDPAPSKTIATFTSTVSNIGSGGLSLKTRTYPYLAVDRTPVGSPTRGYLYVVFQARPTSAASPRSEVFFTRSTDGGVTWSAPRDITSGSAATLGADTTPNDNWMPSISVSPVTGHVKVLLYSRRADPANQVIRIYEAGSTDGGVTWYNRPFSSGSFTPSTLYDPIFNNGAYFGDYIHAFADANGLFGAWGDSRNVCTPPAGAPSPCSPAGRGDQDVWSLAETDATGIDLFIKPWGAVSGEGPLWQTPDIFVVTSMGAVTNAHKGVVNRLRARVRNLGNAAAAGAVVRFRYAPIFAGLADSAFKQIAMPAVDFAAAGDASGNDVKVVPVDWDLTDLTDTNGGQWPMPISAFDHFCVRVDVVDAADINQSNNAAQNNFFDVTDASGPGAPTQFMVGNPFKRVARARLAVEELPKGYDVRVSGVPLQDYISLKPGEIRVAKIAFVRPAGFQKQPRTRDVVASISMIVEGKRVGGISVRLARANVLAPKKPVSNKIRVSSTKAGSPPKPMPEAKPTPPARALVAANPAVTVRTLADMLRAQNLAVIQADQQTGIVSAGPAPLTYEQLVRAVTPVIAKTLPHRATGRYYISFAARPTDKGTDVVISARIVLVASPDEIDSPIGGRLVPSNGTIEATQLRFLAQRLKTL